jgi:hypothetical protein
VSDVQNQILQPLSQKDAEQLTGLLAKLVAGHDDILKNGAPS